MTATTPAPTAVELTDRDLWLIVWGLLVGGKEDPAGSNAGIFVQRILGSVPGLKPGDPWCQALVSCIGRALFGRHWRLPNTGSCDNAYETWKRLGYVVETPEPGDLGYMMHGAWDARHVFVVVAVHPDRSFATREGNAAPMTRKSTREGTEVAERTRGTQADTNRYVFVRLFTPEEALR
jgi:hypothetical protein